MDGSRVAWQTGHRGAHMPEDEKMKPRHPVTSDADRPPIPAVDRQRAYRRSKGAKSLDVSAETHGLLRRLCGIEGTGIDATLRSVLEAALRDRAVRDVLEAAWVYPRQGDRHQGLALPVLGDVDRHRFMLAGGGLVAVAQNTIELVIYAVELAPGGGLDVPGGGAEKVHGVAPMRGAVAGPTPWRAHQKRRSAVEIGRQK